MVRSATKMQREIKLNKVKIYQLSFSHVVSLKSECNLYDNKI